MQIRNLARFAAFATVTLVTIAVPALAQDVDRSALEARTVADINAPAVVKAMAAKRHEESSAVVDNEHTTALQSMSRRDAALEKRFGPLAVAGIGMGVKAVAGIVKGIKKLIRKKKAKKAARKAAAAAAAASASASSGASAASEKRDVVHDEDAPITILDPRDFDFTGLTDGIAKGVKALGKIVKVFKDMKKKKQSDGDTAPVDDSNAAPAAASKAGTASQKRDVAHDESASLSSAAEASSLEKRKTIVKRPVFWVA
ncbi:hypothetical protein MAPG_02839 [Magnaporthiopsis poae ATCC 64411]|uniref:Uncharacterized protein n=1 Tax=Magnaporthiopsis poae (strain ATCC 64411 / 73-15) TaxID=644358 RepID=A0A0C4DSG0_MAGP6|nr:hypothetical protein MAPG_02839 [Magnaporthiopsis poae ATCC 64411]